MFIKFFINILIYIEIIYKLNKYLLYFYVRNMT